MRHLITVTSLVYYKLITLYIVIGLHASKQFVTEIAVTASHAFIVVVLHLDVHPLVACKLYVTSLFNHNLQSRSSCR